MVDTISTNYSSWATALFSTHITLLSIFKQLLSATKHGNGRDWWLITQKQGTNCSYVTLQDSSGFHIHDSIFRGPITPILGGQDRSTFSTDGSKYIYLEYFTGLYIYDFDRCTGSLSNLKYLPIPAIVDSGLIYMGVAISPNNRFLYLSLGYHLYQLDLQSADIFDSIDTIGTYDGWYLWNPNNGSYFDNCQLAPDGKIYISCGATIPYYHVINNPDEKGAACNFVQRGANLHNCQRGIPNYPNYRLGALTQSQCDTLGLLSDIQRAAKEQIIKVYPNPAQDYAIIDYGFTDWSKAQPTLTICNTLGQTVYTRQLPMYSGLQKIDITPFASGMYTVYIKRNNAVIASSKLVKQ